MNLEFLRNALLGAHNEEGGPNIIQRFFSVELMEPPKLIDEPSFINAAEDLAHQLEDFFVMDNFAQRFSEECGFRAMNNITSSTDTDIQLLYLRLIPLIAENCPEYQTVMAKSELFAHLLQLLPKQNVDSKTKQAIVSAISPCVRSCPTPWEKLFDLGGVDKIQKVLEEESLVLVAKAAHFLQQLSHKEKHAKERNRRERLRMHRLNSAFNDLRNRLPSNREKKISKKDTLLKAIEYICHLNRFLRKTDDLAPINFRTTMLLEEVRRQWRMTF
ncbi:hypothetical protein CAEBREN_21529 [Caenorhabditis brenneri]|uniref:BHLH domain-containing protein n=1 Tax=Caenorhabditis brenneri TaxID=135651 RepID=G0NYR0_CAEBE|nr:hypothetical protein CAEBREN_21529 [Caenorhabditis brenneri]